MTEDQLKEVKIAWARGETVQYLYGHSGNQEWLDWKIKNGINFEHSHGWRVKQKTIMINGIEVPAPLRKVEIGQQVFYIEITTDDLVLVETVKLPSGWDYWLSLGIIHSTYEAAKIHAKALLSFTDGTK